MYFTSCSSYDLSKRSERCLPFKDLRIIEISINQVLQRKFHYFFPRQNSNFEKSSNLKKKKKR